MELIEDKVNPKYVEFLSPLFFGILASIFLVAILVNRPRSLDIIYKMLSLITLFLTICVSIFMYYTYTDSFLFLQIIPNDQISQFFHILFRAILIVRVYSSSLTILKNRKNNSIAQGSIGFIMGLFSSILILLILLYVIVFTFKKRIYEIMINTLLFSHFKNIFAPSGIELGLDVLNWTYTIFWFAGACRFAENFFKLIFKNREFLPENASKITREWVIRLATIFMYSTICLMSIQYSQTKFYLKFTLYILEMIFLGGTTLVIPFITFIFRKRNRNLCLKLFFGLLALVGAVIWLAPTFYISNLLMKVSSHQILNVNNTAKYAVKLNIERN